jgi:hypothetical protein
MALDRLIRTIPIVQGLTLTPNPSPKAGEGSQSPFTLVENEFRGRENTAEIFLNHLCNRSVVSNFSKEDIKVSRVRTGTIAPKT